MILIVYGTRPEYIKVKPLMIEMDKQGIKYKTLFTGQHKDIVKETASFNLDMKYYGENRLDNIIQNCMNLPDEWFEGITQVLVQGDTTSVTGLALAAMHRKISVIHLEAGLRTYDTENPFPEENNRRIVSTIAKIHLCPTELNKTNLENEMILGDIHVVGNTVLDNLLPYKKKCEYTNKVLVTLHRRENHDLIEEWFSEINNLSLIYPDLEFILPIHPNPNVQKYKHLLTNVKVIEPLQHEELLELLVKTKMVITDSGGLQEECSFFNKKCLVCREITERPESINLTSFMVKKPEHLKDKFDYEIKNYETNFESPYGDGTSAKKIIKILKKYENIC
jgi:UDP-N-acetylglucosamine 2-epimerase (non-hydrolysing)